MKQSFGFQKLIRRYSSISLGRFTGLERVATTDNVYVAMSGGVDSSTVAALLAKKYGPERVKGIYMNNWASNAKCQERNWSAVRQITSGLDIECLRVDFEREYWTNVFEPMLAAYQQGLTPNPDVNCNYYIKFGRLVEYLKSVDPNFKWVATGHYAGIDPDSMLIRRAEYLPKDQSYYLATVPSTMTPHILLPLSSLSKPAVRELASELGLGSDVACKPDSQGLCFVEQQDDVGQRGFSDFLAEYLVEEPGPFVLASDRSKVVGTHRGLWSHTIGQRASVSLPQHIPEYRGQWFVVQKDIENNALVLDRSNNTPLLMADHLYVKNFVWHKRVSLDTELYAQYRSLQKPWKINSWNELGNGMCEFSFCEKRRAIAPGQYLVVYADDQVVGAGAIDSVTFPE